MSDQILNNLSEFISSERDYLIELVKQMVSIRTVNPPGENYLEFCQYLVDVVGDIEGFKTEIIEVDDEYVDKWNVERDDEKRYCFLAESINKNSYPTLHYTGHFDVVPPTSNWTKDTFNPIVEGDRIYGRGSGDMKSLIACMIMASRALSKCVDDPRFNITMSYTPDEEIGGETGAGYINEKNLVRGDLALIEGLHEEGLITRFSKALLWLEVEIIGKPAHSSMNYLGLNAYRGAMIASEALFELEEELKKDRTSLGLMDERHGYTTMNIGSVASGGTKENTVCDKFTFSIDSRIIPEQDVNEFKETVVERIAESLEGTDFNFNIREIQKIPFVDGDPDEKYIPLIKRAYHRITGKEARVVLTPFFTDSRHFLKSGIPTLGLGVDCEGVHGDDENVSISGLVDMSILMAMVAVELGRND
jgi:succinyl-diaminopimelate desuccinylase